MELIRNNTDNYFKKKKSLFTSVSIMKGKRPVLIYFCYQTDSEVPNTSIYSAVFLDQNHVVWQTKIKSF
jgi:hypothetical protein